MSDEPDANRRTALKTLGALGLGTLAIPAIGSARADDVDQDGRGGRRSRTARSADAGSSDTVVDPSRTGVYIGVVDRIVDGEHVVILLEEGDEVVDQAVVPHEEWPFLEESDIVRVVCLDGTVILIQQLDERPGENAD